MDEPPQTGFDIDGFENSLALNGTGKDGAGDQIGGLLGIAYGIEVAEDFFGRKRWGGGVLFGAFFRRHYRKGKREAKLDAFFEEFANLGHEGIYFDVIARRGFKGTNTLDAVRFVADGFLQFNAGEPLEN